MVVAVFVFALFALPFVVRKCKAFFCSDMDGNIMLFDSQVREITARLDREMHKEGYIVGEKTGESEQLLSYNGVDMRLLKVYNSYSRPVEVVSHRKTAYQQAISWAEGITGRLPALFYALDMVTYEGERKEVSCDTTVECRYIQIEDGKGRLFGGDYYTYASTMERRDVSRYVIYDDDDRVIEEYSDKKTRTGKHFDGDLFWLKNKAYNNYVSPIMLNDMFEWYE